MSLRNTSAGTKLNLLIGPVVPVPAPAVVMDALESVEVATSDTKPGGFSLTFALPHPAGVTGGPAARKALTQLAGKASGARVVLTCVMGAVPDVLMDGIVETADVQPGEGGVSGTLTLMGRDLTALMDREASKDTYPGQGADTIVRTILARYARYGVIPLVMPTLASLPGNPVEGAPTQKNETDLAMIRRLAAEADYVFSLRPGPVPMVSTAYWGPRIDAALPQPALSVDMGAATNATNLSFELDEPKAAAVEGEVLEPNTGVSIPVVSGVSLRPPLALYPSLAKPATRRRQTYGAKPGESVAQSFVRALAQADATADTLKATGDLDTGAYGRVLRPGRLVGLRGAGFDHDGLYWVRDVIHKIARGSHTQSFTCARPGLGSTVPLVRV